jgi:hypothetical protein
VEASLNGHIPFVIRKIRAHLIESVRCVDMGVICLYALLFDSVARSAQVKGQQQGSNERIMKALELVSA